MTITLNHAKLVIAGAIAKARSEDFNPMSVVVLDAGGHPVMMIREDGASLFRHDIARAKAYGALGMGVDTKVLAQKAKNNPVFFSGVSSITDGNIAFSPGGNLIKNDAGTIIGAVGISGDTGPNDEICAIAGIEAGTSS